MESYKSDRSVIRIDSYEPATGGPHPALVLLHGSGGAVSYWTDRFAPVLTRFGVAAYAPHYFEKTGSTRVSAETILDGKHFPAWLAAAADAVSYVAALPSVDPARVGVLGISLGGYLAMALAVGDRRLRLVVELSGGIPPEWEDRMSARMPPVLVMHGTEDQVVPVSEARRIEALLRQHNVPHQVELFPGEGHWFSTRVQPQLLMHFTTFLSRYL